MEPRTIGLLTAAALTAMSTFCFGETHDTAAAEALFRQGREAMKRKDYAVACPKFAESQRLDPAPGTLINLAQCLEDSGKLAQAWQRWQEAIDSLAPNDDRLGGAKRKAASLDARVPKLTIVMPRGATLGSIRVFRDGTELGPASLGSPLPVDPGDHVVTIVASGHSDNRLAFALKESESKTIEAEPGAASSDGTTQGSAAEPSKKTPAHPEAVGKPTGGTLPLVGYAVGGVGIVGIGLGTYFALSASSKKSKADGMSDANGDCLPDTVAECQGLTHDSQSAGNIAIASFIVGGATLVAGATIVIVSASSNKQSSGPAVALRTLAGPGVAGLAANGVW